MAGMTTSLAPSPPAADAVAPRIARAMSRLEADAGQARPARRTLADAEALAREAAEAGEEALAMLASALARSVRRGGGGLGVSAYLAALREVASLGPARRLARTGEALAASIAVRLGGG